MTDNNNISPQDRDLLLAQALGQVLEGNQSVDSVEDPLINTLLAYKQDLKTEESKIDIPTTRLWDSIENEMNTARPAKIHTLGKKNSLNIWAMAATILIAAFAGIFWLTNLNNPVLIGESGSEKALIELNDGSTVTLRPNSKLYEISESNDLHQFAIDGEGYFEVVSNPNREFKVEAGDAVVTVLGTKFVLSNWGTTGSVYLEEGKVRFETRDLSSSVVLAPGQSSKIIDGEVSPVAIDKEDIYKDWLNNVITLDGQSIAYLFAELEQHYNIQLSADSAVYSETIGGSIELDNIIQTLDDLATVLGGTFIKTGEDQYRFNSLD